MRNMWAFPLYGVFVMLINWNPSSSEAMNMKTAKTFQDQLEILRSRGMFIDDKTEALEILKRVNYYRLTVYALQFSNNNHYTSSISFTKMYKIYEFDEKLRSLLMSIIEIVEIRLKTYTAYYLAHKYGPLCYNDIAIYENPLLYSGSNKLVNGKEKHTNGLKDNIYYSLKSKQSELFVKHYSQTKHGVFPIWVIVEVFSFGMICKMYQNLFPYDRKQISSECFNVHDKFLYNWLNTLNRLRNMCAHYSRIYNNTISPRPKVPNIYASYCIDDVHVFSSILVLKTLISNSDAWESFKIDLTNLIKDYCTSIDLKLIGFPDNWEEILNQ